MNINQITSSSNSLPKRIRALHERKNRDKEQLFIVEGLRAVDEAFAKKLAVRDLVVSQSFLDQERSILANYDIDTISVIDDKQFKELSTTTSPAGVIAVAEMPSYAWTDLVSSSKTLIVVAHAIQDPGNLGTMMRTALAASATGLVLTKGTVDPFNPKVVRAAMGALFALPVVWGLTLPEVVARLREEGVRVVTCDASGEVYSFNANLRSPLALIFGNEANGFTDDELSLADEVVSIPMNPQSESLNVAISAAVVLFNVVQQRLKSANRP